MASEKIALEKRLEIIAYMDGYSKGVVDTDSNGVTEKHLIEATLDYVRHNRRLCDVPHAPLMELVELVSQDLLGEEGDGVPDEKHLYANVLDEQEWIGQVHIFRGHRPENSIGPKHFVGIGDSMGPMSSQDYYEEGDAKVAYCNELNRQRANIDTRRS